MSATCHLCGGCGGLHANSCSLRVPVTIVGADIPALIAERDAALLRVEVLHNALAEAQKGIKLLEDLTACGSDDDYVLAIKKIVEDALGSTTEAVATPRPDLCAGSNAPDGTGSKA